MRYCLALTGICSRIHYINPKLLQMNSQIVRVKALNNVVSIMTLEEKDPSCPMFFAMI